MSVARGRAMKARINRPHEVSEPMDPMQQYRRWQFLEAQNEKLRAVADGILGLELGLLQRLKGKDEKTLRELIWQAADALKGQKS